MEPKGKEEKGNDEGRTRRAAVVLREPLSQAVRTWKGLDNLGLALVGSEEMDLCLDLFIQLSQYFPPNDLVDLRFLLVSQNR